LKQIKEYMRIVLVSVLLFTTSQLHGSDNHIWKGKTFESKWDRVKEKAKSIFWGGVATRLQAKDEIMEVLLKQEDGYPIVYVDKNATGNEDGSSWENAFTDIQDAINYLSDKGLEGWVWVAKGLYSSPKNPRSVVIIKQGVMLFGGFNGDETRITQRDSAMHETIIQGWVGSEGRGQRGVDMQHLTLLDGFTIRSSGFTRGVEWQYWGDKISGGGIRTRSWLSIIRNNIIYGNHAKGGAAIAVYALNEDDSYIYASHNVPGYDPIIEHNIMYENHAVCGAVQLRNSETLFYQNILYNNFHIPDNSEDRSKGVEMIMHTHLHDPPMIINCILWHNTGHSSWTPDLYNNKYRSNPPDSKADSYYNCVEKGGYGEGLVTVDPQFVDPENHNFTLKKGSPCIDAGYPDAPPDPDGSRSDIGIPIRRYQLFIDKSEAGGIINSDTWYYPGTFVDISMEEEILDAEGTTKYEFAGWVGEGEGSYTGPSRKVRIQLHSNITEKVVWKIQHKLEVITNIDEYDKNLWYDEDDTVTIAVPAHMEIAKEERRKFISWTGTGSGSYSGEDTSTTVIMHDAIKEKVNWKTEFYVQISTEHGEINGEGWYQEGSNAECSLDSSLIAGIKGERFVFEGWQGSGQGSFTGMNLSYNLIVYNPVIETAKWKTQYFLTVDTEKGNATGQGWYDADSTAIITVDTIEAVDQTRRYHFWKWKGTGSESYSGSTVSPHITIKSPVTEKAIWRLEFWNRISIDPPGMGSVYPISNQGGWWAKGEEIQLLATGNADSGYGFVRWSGDMESSANPFIFSVDTTFNLTAHFKLGDVRIETDPEGLLFKTDGKTYKAPRVFYWLPGEKHTLEGVETQSVSEDTQYVFDHWQQGGGREQEIQIPQGKITFRSVYKEKYAVKVMSDFNNETVKGTGWYFKGNSAVVSIDSIALSDSSNRRCRFIEWKGSGYGAVSDSRTQITITVNGPVTEQAVWHKQFLLNAQTSPHYGGTINYDPQGQWHDSTTTVIVLAVPADTNFTFTGWSGFYDGTDNPVSVNLYQPVNLKAHFSTTSIFPPKVSAMPNVAILEDDTIRYSYFKLYKYVQDLNDSMGNLKFSTPNSHFTAENDKEKLEVRVCPDANWNGTEDVVFKVTDPYMLSDSTILRITVVPVSDPPGEFSLIEPADGYILSGNNNTINFTWHSSQNVDVGDSISYVFYLSKDSTFSSSNVLTISTEDTSLFVNSSKIKGVNYWSVKARDRDDYTTWAGEKRTISYFSGVVNKNSIPETFFMNQNYPNPFNSSTTISYTIPSAGKVTILIRDSKGRKVKELYKGKTGSGSHSISWPGIDGYGNSVPSGLYFAEVIFDNKIFVKKILLVR